MNIKDFIKKTYIGKIKARWNRKKNANIFFNSFYSAYMKESATNVFENDPKYLRLKIIIETHKIEKGLSHNQFKAGFGKDTVISLVALINEYAKLTEYDNYVVECGCSVLQEYHKKNAQFQYDDSDYLDFSRLPQRTTYIMAGSKDYDVKDIYKKIEQFDFSSFSSLRSSVRLFDTPSLKISEDLLLQCIENAQNAPSACNRQSVRVHVLKKQSIFRQIEELQMGCKGFGRNADSFIFITNDLTLYECNEVKLPIFDAAVFTMNLAYALLDKGIFSCVLNASFPAPGAEKKIRNIVGIPKNEMINGLIALYQPKESEKILVPVSPRRNVVEICSFTY